MLRTALPAAFVAALLFAAPVAAREPHEWITQPRHSAAAGSDGTFRDWLATVGSRWETLARAEGPALAYAVVEPRDYRLDYRFARTPGGMAIDFDYRQDAAALPPPVRGTVLLLHGWGLDAGTMLPWAVALSQAGYRTVLMDLRGHGRSGDGPVGYGTREADDLLALLASLRAGRRIAEPVHALGVSYGAVAAVHAAARPGAGIAGVVAMEPFANAADSVRDYAALMKSGGTGWRGRARAWWLRATLDDEALEQALDRAGEALALDLRSLDTATPLAAVPGCVLLLHGAEDRLVPVAAGRRLAAASPRVAYAELPDENHFTLPARLDWLAAPLAQWFAAQSTASGDCPDVALPPDPAP